MTEEPKRRYVQPTIERLPLAVGLIGNWKRSLTQQALSYFNRVPKTDEDLITLAELARLYFVLQDHENTVRASHGLRTITSAPEWAILHAPE